MDKVKYYITSISITEANENGEFVGDSYEYRVKTDSEFTNDNFKDVIFQAIEIERIYKGKLFVVIQKEVVRKNMDENNPEYITTDEVVINVNATLTKNRSKFINWDKCGLTLPPIYEIDRENSTIESEI